MHLPLCVGYDEISQIMFCLIVILYRFRFSLLVWMQALYLMKTSLKGTRSWFYNRFCTSLQVRLSP